MAVPKRKTSLHRKRVRRSHHAIGKPHLRPCPKCAQYTRSHRICSSCGYYKDVQYIIPKEKINKKEDATQS